MAITKTERRSLDCDDAPFAMIPVVNGGWILVTSHHEPLGGECETENDARHVLEELARTFRRLIEEGYLDDW